MSLSSKNGWTNADLRVAVARLESRLAELEEAVRAGGSGREVDVAGAAALLGVCEKTIYRMADTLPHRRMGRHYHFPVAGLEAWKAARTTNFPPAEGAEQRTSVATPSEGLGYSSSRPRAARPRPSLSTERK